MRLRKDQVITELKEAVRGGKLAAWHGLRAIGALTKDVDPKLVRRALERVFEQGYSLVPECRRLPDEYVPLLLEVVKQRSPADHVFLESWLRSGAPVGPQVRAAAAWLRELRVVDSWPYERKKHLAALAKLVRDERGLEASQAVVASGVPEGRMLALLAFEGSESSVDVLMPLVVSAVRARDASLDRLAEWVVPFARGPVVAPAVAEVQRAVDERAGVSPFGELLRLAGHREGTRFNLDVQLESRERVGVSPRATAWVVLQTHRLPRVALFITRHTSSSAFDALRVEDGVVQGTPSLPLTPPADFASLPRWLGEVAKQLEVRWLTEPTQLKSSLRGKGRQRAVEWLLGAR